MGSLSILCGKVSASLIYFEKSRETPCLYAPPREKLSFRSVSIEKPRDLLLLVS